MRTWSIPNATEVYGNASTCEITRRVVDHAALADLSRSLRRLVQLIGEELSEDFWQRTLNPIRRTAFLLCSTPLPFTRLATLCALNWDQLDRQIKQSKLIYPDTHELLDGAVRQLKELLLEDGSPLIPPLEDLHREHGSLAVLLRNVRMNRYVADYFAATHSLRNATVVSAAMLRSPYQCRLLVPFGPCGWFPEHVFMAPKAAAIHVISFRWIRDDWRPEPLFLNGSDSGKGDTSSHRLGKGPRLAASVPAQDLPAEPLNPRDLVPPTPALAAMGSMRSTSQQSDGDNIVPARLCHLAGSRAVFVGSEEGDSSLIIDMSEIGVAVVRRVPTSDLEPGMYLLLRTAGGGDFIAPLADKILGDSAAARRFEQADWKEQLHHAAVQRFGARNRRELSSLICSALQSQGQINARPANIHYWMSSKCIRPRSKEDFDAALNFAGLGSHADRLWDAMGEIDRAHRRAGHMIRRMLLQQIATMALDELERDGTMDFQLGDDGGGSVSAFQITEVLAEDYEVPADKLGVLMDLEE